ncbi:HK97 family phage prohead protease [Clostridium formicaceticum]|uniref:Caudovirus prohead protease n=1 Tax=Clostridium formicaceticum TaxID=1497 RepID=A0AAC9WG28_9CLOT|nr:HK97 family phage prohead protease [Clostridium formicaceticum]AOY76912.1 hypothetical protein BJL90_14240 [Clostridium formicaceticum]ARE87391.1 Caudovirus prohead protease [Clostridium formicaceticum]
MTREKEIRQLFSSFEVRTNEETNEELLEGYALKFESWSENFGDWREIISSTALEKTNLSDVRALINHDSNYILARNTAGNLSLEVDSIGLRFKMKPAKTTYYRDLLENIKAGNINQCSFGFWLRWDNSNCEEWSYNEDLKLYERRINDIETITEISILSTPAYKSTEVVMARGLNEYKSELQRQLNKRKLAIELEL